MDANVTTSQSEHEHDNSSLQNPSTNPAEAGTTDETRDEDHETSSIEALNWSEVEEEELAAAQQATLVSSAAQGKLPTETNVNNSKQDKDDESVTNNGSSNNDEGSVLSTTLLQSINSSVSDEDPQARKLTVIENWASEVTNAVERGEIELAEDFPDENGTTGDDEEGEVENNGVRKRKGKKLSPEMVSSMMSSVSNGESIADPLSNAPVLDDGPIWNKGPRSYTFQENRRFNQKLTFCLLIAVVLAIGLGLGNLVAHQECEAEFKATQQSQIKPAEKISVQTVPTTTTPAPIIPDRSTDSTMMGSTLPKKQPISYTGSSVPSEKASGEGLVSSENGNEQAQQQRQQPVKNTQEDRRRKRDEPVIDPKYRAHAETVSNVVHTLDRLSREIDQFENTTRKLQGVLMIPEEKPTTESPTHASLYDEEIHIDGDDRSMTNSDEITLEDEEDETAIIEDLIDAIEQTPEYLELKKSQKRLEELNELNKNMPRSKIFGGDGKDSKAPTSAEKESDIATILKSIQQFKEFERRFIKSERKRLRDAGKYKRFSWRLPEEYSADEKNALRVRYRSNWDEFLKLIQNKVPDPIEALFGVEEDEEERTYGDVFHYAFPDPDDDLTPEEYDTQFRMNLEEAGLLKKSSSLSSSEKTDASEEKLDEDSSTTSHAKEEEDASAAAAERLQNLMKAFDDLIVIESKEEHPKTTDKEVGGENDPKSQTIDVNGKSTKSSTIDESQVLAETPPKTETVQSTKSTAAKAEGTTNNDIEKLSTTTLKRETSSNKPVYKVDNIEPGPITNLNRKKFLSKSQTANNGKTEKFDEKQKDLKMKQGKKIKNVSNDSNVNAKNNYKNSVNFKNGASNENGKMYSKGKKLRYLKSNEAFENIQGKSIDNRRDASPETQRKFGADTKHSDIKIEKNFAAGKRSPTESTKYKKDEIGGQQHDETSNHNQVKHQKVKRQAQDYHDADNQKNFNSESRNYKNRPNNRPSRPDLRESREQKRQDYVKNKNAFSDEHVGKAKMDSSAEGSQFRQQTGEFNNRKHDTRDSDRDHNSSNHPNGKRSKSWVNKDRADRREKAR